jgi:CBS-domain-containing membrane protein
MEISDQDVLEAMGEMEGYLDITPGDFKEIYRHAYARALERIRRKVPAREVMTREVATVRPETPVKNVAELMALRGVSGVPVVDEAGAAVGVISERDFLAGLSPQGARSFMEVLAHCLRGTGCIAVEMRKQQAREIMTAPAVTVREETPVSEIGRIFSEKGINRVPVVDGEGRVVGIVSRADLIPRQP